MQYSISRTIYMMEIDVYNLYIYTAVSIGDISIDHVASTL